METSEVPSAERVGESSSCPHSLGTLIEWKRVKTPHPLRKIPVPTRWGH